MNAPEQAFALGKHGEALAAQGRWDDAVAAFTQALALAPGDPVLHNNLAVIQFQAGRLDDAAAAFGRALALDPAYVAAHSGLAFVLLHKGDRAGAIAKFADVARLDPTSTQSLMALYHLLQLEQRVDEALAYQAAALAQCQLYSNPSTGPTQTTILVLKAPGDLQTNIPVDLLFDRARFTLHDLYLVEGIPDPAPEALPPYDLVFNAISESQRARPALAAAARFIARQGKPWLNDPKLVEQLSRDRAPALFAGIDGCHFPPTLRVAREALLAGGDPVAALAACDIVLPIVIRPIESHAGSDFERLETAAELGGYLDRVVRDEYYVARFIDYRSEDGLYRKYRVIFVDGKAFPCHLAISRRWMIHYLNADMGEFAWMREEEERFLADLSSVFAGRLGTALEAIAARSGLDYVGMDCTIDREGRVLVFEIDAAMIVHLWDPIEVYPYKHKYIPRIFAAVEDLVGRRVAAARG